MSSFEPVLTKNIGKVDLTEIANWEAQGGYQGLRKALAMTPKEVLDEVVKSNLRGRGGAGFPAGRKWSFLPADGRARYLCCNLDESEPGTFNNRMLVEFTPHQIVEGVLIAAYAAGCSRSFIYCRGEFKKGAQMLEKAIAQARARGYLGDNIMGSGFSQEVIVHRGAGAYICGEETALLNSLEGKRGEPRLRPPFPAVSGLYAMPTVINNAETLSNLPHILRNGADWFLSIGTPQSPGPKIFSVSGRVKRPGNYELPLGTTIREVIWGHAGGMLDGHTFKAVQPGGASAPVLTEAHLDVPMDFENIAKAGSLLGTAGVVVMDDTVCMVKASLTYVRFFAHESCGQCTPCREGSHWLQRVLERIENGGGRMEDLDMLKSMFFQMQGTTICLLSDACTFFLQSALKHFGHEFEAHIRGDTCHARKGVLTA